MTKKYQERYYTLTEDEMQALISEAQRGSSSAQMQLLEVFGNFLSKYTTLLYHGKYNLGDYDIRRFISMYVKDPSIRFYLLRNKLSAAGAKHVHDVIRPIQTMAQRYGDEEDVEQTVRLAFFECIAVYERKGEIPFSGFLYSYYFYKLKKQVDALLIDQLGRKSFPLIADDDYGEGDDDERQPGFTAPPTAGADELIMAEEIDEYWVAGDRATGPFANLSVQDRQLLRWRYVDGERSSDIAHRITEHPNTVREHFNRIRARVREYLEAEGIE